MKIILKRIEPIGKRVIIEEMLDTVDSSLEMSNSAAPSTPVMGKIIKAGQGSTYKAKQIVFFRRYSVDEIKIFTDTGEQKILLLEDDEIIATYPTRTVVEKVEKTQREMKIEDNLKKREGGRHAKRG